MSYIQLEPENYYMLNWLEEYMIGHKGFICGGCFKNIFSKEKVKDLDIFFETEQDYYQAMDYFDSHTEGYGYEGDKVTKEEATWIFIYENSKVKSYKNKETGIRVELCRSIFGKPKDIIDEFDFTITKFAVYMEKVYDSEELGTYHMEKRIMCSDKFFEHLYMKRLVIDDKIPYPMSTFERVIRYARYGYFPCKETKLKLALAINNLDPVQIDTSKSLYDGID